MSRYPQNLDVSTEINRKLRSQFEVMKLKMNESLSLARQAAYNDQGQAEQLVAQQQLERAHENTQHKQDPLDIV